MTGGAPERALDDGAAAIATEPQLQPAPSPPASRTSLVIQTSFLGDTVLTTPLIAELARRGPVDVVVTPAAAPLLANHPGIRDVILYDKRGDARGMTGLWRASRTLVARCPPGSRSAHCFDAAYLAQGSVRSAMLALLAGIAERVGFATSAGRLLYTRAIPFRDDLHHAERLWRLAMPAEASAPEPDRLRPRLYPGESEQRAVQALLAEHGWDGEPLIALAPGSVWATKRWPYFADLAKRLAPFARIAIIGGKPDADAEREIIEALGGTARAIPAVGRLSLLASAELIGRSRVLVTNDSAPLHLASAMNTPTVAIFGPTVPEFGFGPLAAQRAVAGHDALPCRPCDRHGPRHCPLGHWRCMRELSPDAIGALAERVATFTST